MNCAERIRIIQLLEKMKEQPVYSKKIGLEDKSSFKGQGNATRTDWRKEQC